jgi:hypothetical protein
LVEETRRLLPQSLPHLVTTQKTIVKAVYDATIALLKRSVAPRSDSSTGAALMELRYRDGRRASHGRAANVSALIDTALAITLSLMDHCGCSASELPAPWVA